MPFITDLPAEVADLIRTGTVAEYATLSAAGVPIDTPTYYFPSDDLTTLDIGTGLAYPAKAERARRNPKVGLLIERSASDPVVSIAGYGAVRDADLQANLNRYVAETGYMLPPGGAWEAMRKSLFYWTRVFVAIAPAHIRWWPNRAAMEEQQPNVWRAARDTAYPQSDPAPPGKMSQAPEWTQASWQELAAEAMARSAPGHLTLCDEEGFPIPMRVRDVTLWEHGFRVTAPKGAPWRTGKATLSFQGREIFIGDAQVEEGQTVLRVERVLPAFPLTSADGTVPRPDRETRARLNERMEDELRRRGQPTPVVPLELLEPTPGSKARMQAARANRPPRD